jgi:peroxiredoxin
MPTQLARILDVTASVLTAVAAAMVIAFLVGAVLVGRRAGGTPSDGTPRPAVGSRVQALPGLDYRKAHLTVVFVVRSSCGYCAKSLAAFRDVSVAAQQSLGRVRCVVVSADDKSTLERYLESHDIYADTISGVSPQSQLVAYTPHLLIVDTDGVIQGDWLGELDQSTGQQVVEALMGLE